MANKTKAELEAEIKELKAEIAELKEVSEVVAVAKEISPLGLLIQAKDGVEDARAAKLVERAIKRLS